MIFDLEINIVTLCLDHMPMVLCLLAQAVELISFTCGYTVATKYQIERFCGSIFGLYSDVYCCTWISGVRCIQNGAYQIYIQEITCLLYIRRGLRILDMPLSVLFTLFFEFSIYFELLQLFMLTCNVVIEDLMQVLKYLKVGQCQEKRSMPFFFYSLMVGSKEVDEVKNCKVDQQYQEQR